LSSSLSKIIGSNAYWFAKLNKLRTSIDQLGFPSIFFTLSCADLYNKIVNRFMKSSKDKRQNIALNVNIVCDVYLIMLKELIQIYLRKAFKIVWYYVRIEYQNRGTIHAHILFKCRDEPSVGNH
jgi:hypothetical protein